MHCAHQIICASSASFYRIVCQGGISYVPQDPDVELPSALQPHADRLGKMIVSAQAPRSDGQAAYFCTLPFKSVWLAGQSLRLGTAHPRRTRAAIAR